MDTANTSKMTPQMDEKNCGETPQTRPAAGRVSHTGREDVPRVVAARCGVLLATLIADALLSDKITDGQRIRLDASCDQIQFRQ